MKVFFFGPFGLGVSAPLVAVGTDLEGGCTGIFSHRGMAGGCHALREKVGQILLGLELFSGLLGVFLICAALLVALIHRIDPTGWRPWWRPKHRRCVRAETTPVPASRN